MPQIFDAKCAAKLKKVEQKLQKSNAFKCVNTFVHKNTFWRIFSFIFFPFFALKFFMDICLRLHQFHMFRERKIVEAFAK